MNQTLQERVKELFRDYGYSKTMGVSVQDQTRPHYFLHRKFLDEQDLLIIFNTKRCRYQCHFCNLPAKSSREWIPTESILAQFEYVVTELRHSLSVFDRITISNEGSVLDTETFPRNALVTIAKCARELKQLKTLVFETRLEFAAVNYLEELSTAALHSQLNVLTGFETLSPHIRDKILRKREPLEIFLNGLDNLAAVGASLTAYVLFKPSPYMTDEEAVLEAERSIDFLSDQCNKRSISLTIRLNPMYLARNTMWEKQALTNPDYQPPRLGDVLQVAERKRAQGIRLYIGLSTEGLDDPRGTYRAREDFSSALLKEAIVSNFD